MKIRNVQMPKGFFLGLPARPAQEVPLRSASEIIRIWFIGLFLASIALPAAAGTVVLLRHAERVSLFDQDSPLSPKGEQRAAGLATLLEGFHPASLIASNRIRTQQTLGPLAKRTHLPVATWDASQTAALAAWLKSNAGRSTIIVCWHHDHMRELAQALGVPEPVPDWSGFTYDKLWIIDLEPGGRATLRVQSQWGRR